MSPFFLSRNIEFDVSFYHLFVKQKLIIRSVAVILYLSKFIQGHRPHILLCITISRSLRHSCHPPRIKIINTCRIHSGILTMSGKVAICEDEAIAILVIIMKPK